MMEELITKLNYWNTKKEITKISFHYLLSLNIFLLNKYVDNIKVITVYITTIIIFLGVIILTLLLDIPLINVTTLSNGKYSQILLKPSPSISFEKYIPLVKHTNWTIILDTPEADFSVQILPIKIPNDIKRIAIIATINIDTIIYNENSSPNIIEIT